MVRAIASTKMHYLPQITQTIEEHRASGGSERWKLADAFPNLSPPSCGMEALSEESWQALKQQFDLGSKADLVKHILTMHDGEARLVGDDEVWFLFPVSDGSMFLGVSTYIRKACFWHYQFQTCAEVRR